MRVREKLRSSRKKKARYLRPRFSPGYGDFDIQYQKPLMQMLDCAKTIGLTMTDSFMMTPTKIGDSSDRNEPYQRAVSDTGLRDL